MDTCNQALFFKAINIFFSGNNRLFFIEILNPCCSEGNIGREDDL
jgi:hypothetical protein